MLMWSAGATVAPWALREATTHSCRPASSPGPGSRCRAGAASRHVGQPRRPVQAVAAGMGIKTIMKSFARPRGEPECSESAVTLWRTRLCSSSFVAKPRFGVYNSSPGHLFALYTPDINWYVFAIIDRLHLASQNEPRRRIFSLTLEIGHAAKNVNYTTLHPKPYYS